MKPKTPADPNAPKKPKKPMNAFFVYRKALRERIIQKYNTTKSHEISKIAGECWAMEPVHVKNYFRDISFKLHEEAREEKIREQRRHSVQSVQSDITAQTPPPSPGDVSRRLSISSISSLSSLNDMTMGMDLNGHGRVRSVSPAPSDSRISPSPQARPLSMDSYHRNKVHKSSSLPHVTAPLLPMHEYMNYNQFGNVSEDILALSQSFEISTAMESSNSVYSAVSTSNSQAGSISGSIPGGSEYEHNIYPMNDFGSSSDAISMGIDAQLTSSQATQQNLSNQFSKFENTPVKLEDFL